MLINVWVFFAIIQVLMIALGCAGFAWWRGRAARARSEDLRSQCEAAEAALTEGKALLETSPHATGGVDERIEALRGLETEADPDSVDARRLALVRTVLEYERDPTSVDLATYLAPKAPGEDTDIDALREENETLKAMLESSQGEGAGGGGKAKDGTGGGDREKELKSLVQQFTHDSREMLTCIQNLEKENNELRSQMGQDAA